jgi:hypothetical protein
MGFLFSSPEVMYDCYGYVVPNAGEAIGVFFLDKGAWVGVQEVPCSPFFCLLWVCCLFPSSSSLRRGHRF